jgi:hypothetical protein
MSILPGPVNAQFGETIAGAAVIRAFGMQSVFVQSQSSPEDSDYGTES